MLKLCQVAVYAIQGFTILEAFAIFAKALVPSVQVFRIVKSVLMDTMLVKETVFNAIHYV